MGQFELVGSALREKGRPGALAIVAAAGSGERLGASLPKALVEVAGRPLLHWSVSALATATGIDEIVVTAPHGHEAAIEEVAARALTESAAGRPPSLGVVSGGPSRSHSVAIALATVPDSIEIVVVHDAARPMVTGALADGLIDALAAAPAEVAAVIAAAPATDTIKRSRQPRDGGGEVGQVAETLDRDSLWIVQTPQVFRLAAIRAALAEADDAALAAAGDDAALVERAGGEVLLYPAPSTNLKVTTTEDLRVVRSMLGDG